MTVYLHYLQSLKYETEPNYDYIASLYQEMLTETGCGDDTLYDWDIPAHPCSGDDTSMSYPMVAAAAETVNEKDAAAMKQTRPDLKEGVGRPNIQPNIKGVAAKAAEPDKDMTLDTGLAGANTLFPPKEPR